MTDGRAACRRWPVPAADAGFTLLEVLIALAILAVAFGFAFEAIGGGVAWLGRAEDEQAALRLAQSTLARLGHDLPVRTGHQAGQEDGYGWTLDIDAPSNDPAPAQGLAAFPLTVAVQWRVDGYDRVVRLRSLRLGPRPEP